MNQSQKRKQSNHNRRTVSKRHPKVSSNQGDRPAGHGSTTSRHPSGRRRYQERKRRRRIKKIKQCAVMLGFLLIAVFLVYLLLSGIFSLFKKDDGLLEISSRDMARIDDKIETMTVDSPKIDVDLLTVNEYSRPGTKLEKVNGIVIHYVGNPGTTAAQNRSFFESLKDTHETSASSHFVVGMDGEIVQCIPTTEVAYCSNERNEDTISIECCHKKENGKFTEETYDSLVHLTAFLCCKYNLEIEDIIRHYDVTGKECPKYYVDHQDKWVQFKKDVAAFIEKNAYKK